MNRIFVTFAAVGVAALSACSNAGTPATNAAAVAKGATAEDPSTVVAQIGEEKITLAELDKEIGLSKQMHEMRQQGLEQMVAVKLVEAEAKRKGVTPDEMMKTELTARVAMPSDAELQALYDARAKGPDGKVREGMPPFEQVKQMIAMQMMQQKQAEAMQSYLDQLKTAGNVKISLPEPAVEKVEVAATGPSKGPADAPVTIVAFSDFQCPFCSKVNPTLDQVMETYQGKVKLVFRDYPLPFHKEAPKASEAAHCADEQGKFWEMHDQLFANQQALQVSDLKNHAGAIKLDQAKFDECLDSGRMAEKVAANMKDGEKAGVQGTPAFFVNGVALSGALPFEDFKKVIDAELGVGATASN
jgi:protein-disulfide isomerase